MKAIKFELKELETKEGKNFRYRDVLEVIVKTPQDKQGILIAEMRSLIKILDKLEAANGSMLLSSDEWNILKSRAGVFPWGMVSREIVQFVDDLEGAKEIELTEAS
ncbi:MAG: hypothetical protein IT393_07325 [Nitrospirae bacterium]|nr:hypothetical protein [Nitrospirota bacterium]